MFRSKAGFKNTKKGRRSDLGGLYVRSSWEANYARYLNSLQENGRISSWKYEPDTFVFYGVKRGAVCYTPDFLIIYPNGQKEYHEVKGYMTSESRTKMKRMKEYYPDVVIKLVDRKEYSLIKSVNHRNIPLWEEDGV